jgi:hypothetical protein
MQLIVASGFVLLCGFIYTGEGKVKDRDKNHSARATGA